MMAEKRIQRGRHTFIPGENVGGGPNYIDPTQFLPEGLSAGDIYPGIKRAYLFIGGETHFYGLRIKAKVEEFESVGKEGEADDVALSFNKTRNGGYIQVQKSGFVRATSEADIIEAVNRVTRRILGRIGHDNR